MQKLDRTKNAVRNVFFGTINRIVTQLLPFVIRTVIIRKLGEEYLGISGLFGSILQVLNLSELGFGTAMVYSMYRPIAENDTEKVCALLNLYRKFYRFIGGAILLAGIAVAPFLPHLIKGSCPPDINIYAVYTIYLFNTAITYLLFAYKGSLLAAHQRNDIENIIQTVMCTIQYGSQIILLFVCQDYYAYIIVMPIITVVTNFIRSYLVDRKYPQYRCRGKLGKDVLVDITKRVSALFGHQLAYTLINSVDNMVISAFLGLSMVAVYNNYYLVMSAIISFMSILISSVTAGIGNSMVVETVEKNKRDLKKFSLLMHWLTGWCTICLICLYQPFITLWMGEKLLLPIGTVILLSFYFYVSEIRRIVNTFKNAAGMWWVDKWKPYVVVLVDIVLDILLVQYIGINGVIIASIVSVLFIYIPWETHVFYKYYLKDSELPFYGTMIRRMLLTIFAGAGTWFVAGLIGIEGIFGLIGKGIVCVVIPNLIFFCVYYKTDEFHGLCDMILRRRK